MIEVKGCLIIQTLLLLSFCIGHHPSVNESASQSSNNSCFRSGPGILFPPHRRHHHYHPVSASTTDKTAIEQEVQASAPSGRGSHADPGVADVL